MKKRRVCIFFVWLTAIIIFYAAAYLAVRIAAADILSDGEPVPLVLDEPFAMYDDAHLAVALRCLLESGRQVILFTCSGREQAALGTLQREMDS